MVPPPYYGLHASMLSRSPGPAGSGSSGELGRGAAASRPLLLGGTAMAGTALAAARGLGPGLGRSDEETWQARERRHLFAGASSSTGFFDAASSSGRLQKLDPRASTLALRLTAPRQALQPRVPIFSVPRSLAALASLSTPLEARKAVLLQRIQMWLPQHNAMAPRRSGMMGQLARLRDAALNIHRGLLESKAELAAIREGRDHPSSTCRRGMSLALEDFHDIARAEPQLAARQLPPRLGLAPRLGKHALQPLPCAPCALEKLAAPAALRLSVDYSFTMVEEKLC